MMKIYQKTIRDKRFKKLKNFRVGSWVIVENASEADLLEAAAKLGLKESLLRDAIDFNEVPRLEVENDGSTYLFTQVPYGEGINAYTSPMLIAITNNCLATVSQRDLPFKIGEFNKKFNFTTTQKVKLLLQILTEINSAYNSSITNINRKVRSLGVHLEKVTNRDIAQFVSYETVLNDFLSNLIPMNSALEKLLSGKVLKLYEEDKELMEDLVLASGQLIGSVKVNLKTIVNIREAYTTIVTNNLNRVIKLLTSLTIILTIPTMIASFYGMNVSLPGASSPDAFFWILAGTGLILIVLLILFIKNRWL
jgi:magnesium transporter